MAHILVIDDNPAVLDALCDMLATAGHAAEGALDGIAGFEKFRRGKFDVVISDIFMPREDGIGTIRKIRRADSRVGIIAMSGGAHVATADQVLRITTELGADFTLPKPVTRPVLLATVFKAQRRPAQ
jgi:DNA-binding response OmpR family regulator